MDCAVFDIETTDLAAVGAGFLLCASIKPLRGSISTLRIDHYHCRPAKEKPLIAAVLEELSKYDLLIGHNITKYDLPYLRSRALVLGVPYALNPLMYDTLHAFRRVGYLTRPNGFGKPSAGLDMVTDFLGIEQEKTKIYPREWWDSVWGDDKRKARVMGDIVNHCEKDVRMTCRVYAELLKADTRATIKRAH